MAKRRFELADPPSDPRRRELWLQNLAGFIIFRDMRDRAIQRLDASLTPDARTAAVRAIDDTVYGLMEIVDGFSGSVVGRAGEVDLRLVVRWLPPADERNNDQPNMTIDLFEGDGMGMGYAGWIEDDFGQDPIVIPVESTN
jgi:hypothetical protein